MIDRSRPPEPGEPHSFGFPTATRRRLPGGLEIVALPMDRVPLLYLGLLVPAGGVYEPEDLPGLASLTGELVDEGTRQRDATGIAVAVEQLGGRLSTGADWDVGYVSMLMLARNRRPGLDLLAELATEATFPLQEIERLRRETRTRLIQKRDRPASLADERLHRALYGEGPYGFPRQGTEASLERCSRERILELYEHNYRLSGATLVAVGDLDLDTLIRQAKTRLGAEDSQPPPQPRTVTPPPRTGVTVHLVDRPGAAQTELRVGHVGVERTHPDYVPLIVTNVILGGQFTSRINLNLRERNGYTYGATSRFKARLARGPFVVSTAVATDVAGPAAREILHEMRRLREEPPSEEELEDTKNYIGGVFAYTLQTIGGLAQRLETVATFGLEDDYYEAYPERVRAVTRQDVATVARRHLHPDRAAVVAVGPAETLRPQLEELGPVDVVSPAAVV